MEQQSSQVLIVEDDQRLAELTREYLQANGFAVDVEGDGAKAAERIINEQPDLVILDLMLPGLDGLQVCRLLRAESQSLPILMLTARDDSHDQVRSGDGRRRLCRQALRTAGIAGTGAHLAAPQQHRRAPSGK